MTREEAIQELQNCKGLIQQDGQDYLDERDIPLLDMAIEALSAEAQAKCIAEIKVDAEDIYTRITGLVADKVDVVRCKDCRHRDLFSCPLADNDFQKDDDYCSWGERREP